MSPSVPSAVRPPPARPELRPVARHRVLAELGQGGMANVYLAVTEQQRVFSKLVVLKALKRELAAQPTSLAMFLDEARVAVQLNHPNIVQTYDVGVHHDRHVMVMEYLDGQPLSALLQTVKEHGHELPLRVLLRIMSSALEGLHYAHELAAYDGTPLAMVHRDVSPHNIFVTYDGHVKVLDFGIAKAATSSTETLTGVVKGKLGYMAPEQLSGETVDRRADIYSVGCMLWAFASGQKLWLGMSDPQIIQRVMHGGDIRVPSGFAAREPEFARIVEKCLAREPGARYQTAAALQHDLERVADKLGPPVRQKEIAALLDELFRGAREDFKRLVQDRLKGRSAYVSVAPPMGAAPDTGDDTVAEPLASKRTETPPLAKAARPSRLTAVATGVLLAAVAGAALVLGRGTQTFAAEAAVDTAVRASVAPAPELVSVRLSVSPAEATLHLDGKPLPRATSLALPRDGVLHTLRVEAKDHAPKSVEFVVKDGLAIGLSLMPIAAPAVAASAEAEPEAEPLAGAALEPRVSSRSVRRARAPSPDCSKPFFLDHDGIKRVRPECR
jgi:tRNA A-37 threonylcarbamoyl transferase component Bud32